MADLDDTLDFPAPPAPDVKPRKIDVCRLLEAEGRLQEFRAMQYKILAEGRKAGKTRTEAFWEAVAELDPPLGQCH